MTALHNSKLQGRRPFKVLVAMVVWYDGWLISVFSWVLDNSSEVDLMTGKRMVAARALRCDLPKWVMYSKQCVFHWCDCGQCWRQHALGLKTTGSPLKQKQMTTVVPLKKFLAAGQQDRSTGFWRSLAPGLRSCYWQSRDGVRNQPTASLQEHCLREDILQHAWRSTDYGVIHPSRRSRHGSLQRAQRRQL